GPRLSVSRAGYSGLDSQGSQNTCYEDGPYVFTDSEGRSHDLGLVHLEPAPTDPGSSLCLDGENDTSVAVDDDSLYAVVTPGSPSSQLVITQAGGTRYFFSIGGTPYRALPYQIEDANGNLETITASGSTETWTDAAGRTALIVTYVATGQPSSIQVYDSGGTSRTYTLTWSTASFNYYPPDPNSSNCGLPGTCIAGGAVTGTVPALTSLALPDGTSYSLGYDPTYGAVNSITYPTGGGASFAWGLTPLYELLQYVDANGGEPIPYDDLAVTRETRSPGGAWQYSYTSTGSGNWTSKTTTITDPSGATTALTYLPLWMASSVGGGNNGSDRALEVQRVVQSAQGQTVRVVTTNYTGLKPHQVQTALADAPGTPLVSEVDYTWGPGADVLEKDEHDYAACSIQAPPSTPAQALTCAAGPLLRKTTRTFLNYTSGSPWIVDKPTSEVVSDGGGTTRSQTQITYDAYGSSGLALSNTVQHDPAYNGSAYTTRGNATAVARWVSGSTWLTTNTYFDDAGNRIETVDAAGHATYFSYADAWTNSACAPSSGNAASYLSRITNALNQVTTFAYNSCTGSLGSQTDANGNPTTYAYADPLDRLTQVSYPDGGVTTYAYTDNPLYFEVETKRKIDSSRWTDAIAMLDGLGRESSSSALNGAGSWDRGDTCYDGNGRVSYRSYPYQASSPTAQPGCSATGDSFQYDTLSRPTLTTHSDATTFVTSYAGRATETQDEGNGSTRVTRIAQTDGLGYLQYVCEATFGAPPSQGPAPAACGLDLAATGFFTSYTHDALGNLTGVTQNAEARGFSYDGLSRLLAAANPETGNTGYVYDADTAGCAAPNSFPGDLVSRTDARGTRTCYQYDPLHRVTQHSYSDGTPAAFLSYDQGNLWGTAL
ncbi:MAG: hypothetical protein ACRDOE_02310, partial [Streptosporangiaceae bacterium]